MHQSSISVAVVHSQSSLIEDWLARLRAGDDSARGILIEHSCDRLRRLTRRMLNDYSRVRRWEETDDVLQNALMRLHRALSDVHPESTRDFISFAAVQIRRELIDLARRHFGPEGIGANHYSDRLSERCDDRAGIDDRTFNPADLAEWTEFHSQVDLLPEPQREVFHLLWYGGLTQGEAAEVLKVARETVNRRWRAACVELYRIMHGTPPASSAAGARSEKKS